MAIMSESEEVDKIETKLSATNVVVKDEEDEVQQQTNLSVEDPSLSTTSSSSTSLDSMLTVLLHDIRPQLEQLFAQNPSIRDELQHLIVQEKLFREQQHQQQHQSKRRHNHRGHRNHNHHQHQESSSSSINNPNDCPISPMELRLIEAADTPEQKVLRLVLQTLLDALYQ